MVRQISQAGIDLIKSFEGCRLTAYKAVPDEAYYTIGYGHCGPDVKEKMTITQQQAESLLASDLLKFEAYVNDPAYVPVTAQLTQNQFDALVSFCYNCGPGNLSNLCKGRTIAQIAENITKYNKSSGMVLTGLVKRRSAELDLFCKREAGKPLDFSQYQWDILAQNVKSLLNRSVITDKAWLEKIENKTLTHTELTWLTFVLAVRPN
ncbi:lysozyme [Paenibacillus yonginensis]|uniref:lysozyme n=1 Tax=Paenibacillus yonginensis TaxID=1462996 RepID=UPI000838FF28|nr:lysozyme [Paenibacillus yonginensis]